MDTVSINTEIYTVAQRLRKSADAMFPLGRERAKTEREYRSALAKEMFKLKAEGIQATLIPDMARGNTAELKFNRDLAEANFKAAIEATRSLQVTISALQSINKYQTDL